MIYSLRHRVFPGGAPSKYYPGPTMLNLNSYFTTCESCVVHRQVSDEEISKHYILRVCVVHIFGLPSPLLGLKINVEKEMTFFIQYFAKFIFHPSNWYQLAPNLSLNVLQRLFLIYPKIEIFKNRPTHCRIRTSANLHRVYENNGQFCKLPTSLTACPCSQCFNVIVNGASESTTVFWNYSICPA